MKYLLHCTAIENSVVHLFDARVNDSFSQMNTLNTPAPGVHHELFIFMIMMQYFSMVHRWLSEWTCRISNDVNYETCAHVNSLCTLCSYIVHISF